MTTNAAEFAELTAPHTQRLYHLGLRLAREESAARDLVQETLTRAWANWDSRKPEGPLGAWLSRILTNAFISNHRRQKVARDKQERFQLEYHLFDPERLAEQSNPSEAWHERGLSRPVRSALAGLPADFRSAVELVDVGGLSYGDAAQRLGVPRGTIMSRLHRARKLLRSRLAAHAREFGIGCASDFASAVPA